ncbi:MAG: tryptophan--tRNA ligase [Bacilli bacterium]
MKYVLTGVKPTGSPTLGNYLGAFKNMGHLQKEMSDYQFIVFIANMHAITFPQDPKILRERTRTVAALYLACGMRAENLIMFIQSEVPEHIELGYVMQSLAYMGELERMTQYKSKKKAGEEGLTSALFTYPTLMASDILLYDPEYVPVGADQTQHLELARTLAERFNNRFSETFTVPKGLPPKVGARIMGLQDPTHKMSKSDDNPKDCICLLDDIASIKKKIKSAVTDNDTSVHFDKENKPGISNLMTIYSSISSMSFDEITKKYKGLGYGKFKADLADIVAEEVQTIQDKYNKWINSKELDDLLDKGAAEAHLIARRKLAKVYRKMGIERKRK